MLNEKALDSSTFAQLDSILSNQHHFKSRSCSSFSPPLPSLSLRLAGFVARSSLNDFFPLKENEKKYLMTLSFSPPNFGEDNKIY